MDGSPGYNAPQITRTYLIPIAKEFLTKAHDESSVDEFVEFVIKSSATPCKRSNVKAWRKDAFKALRLVNAQQMMSTPKMVISESATEVEMSDQAVLQQERNIPKKRSRIVLDATPSEAYSVRIPTIRLSDIQSTTPPELRRQLKCFIRAHLSGDIKLPVWPSILVSGPPFCGKSTLIEAVCGSLGTKLLIVSVGTVAANIRSWTDVFNHAKSNAPCVLLLDDIESMEKSNVPTGSFRLTCLLKSQLLKDLIGSGVVLIGETRSLLASLPQSVVDLFTQRITFGMLREEYRLSLLRQYFTEESSEFVVSNKVQTMVDDFLQLSDGMTCLELARRTPGYEVGDIIRFVAQLRMAVLSRSNQDSDAEENKGGEQICTGKSFSFTVGGDELLHVASGDSGLLQFSQNGSPHLVRVTRDLVDECLAAVVPAVKNTAEFVTIPDVTWANVGGLEGTRTQLHNRFMLLVDDWERAQALHRRSGGVLLEGPPGCGKTLVAKALSNQAGLNFLSVKGPEVLNKFQGESERRVREIFERARACQPCLIFFDEIDAICPRRDSDESTGSRVSLVNQLLVELDGIDKHRSGRVFVIGATNRKDMIDPAVLRPGRLGLHLMISPPATASDRTSVLAACTKSGTAPQVDGGMQVLCDVANDVRTDGMSGADLENLLELAKQNAQLDQKNFLTRKHLFDALNELRPCVMMQ